MNRRAAAISIVTNDTPASSAPFVLHPAQRHNEPASSTTTFDASLDAIYRRRWWILSGVILAVTAAWGISRSLPQTYQAAATLEVERSSVSDLVRELQSDAVVLPVIDKFHLTGSDRAGLKVTGPADSQRIRITYRHRDPQVAAGVANWIAKSYIERSPPGGPRGGLNSQLSDLNEKMDQSQQKLLEFVHKNGVADPEAKMNQLTARLLELDMSYAKAHTDREAKEAALQVIPAGSPENTQAEAELKRAREREEDLSAAYARTKSEADVLPGQAAEYRTLRERADADRA
jgi:uncharacterized protein involved in exopolysaccharide biosynthesis